MQRIILTAMLPAILLAASSCVQTIKIEESDLSEPVRAELFKAILKGALDELLPHVGTKGIVEHEELRQLFEYGCAGVAAPGAEADRVWIAVTDRVWMCELLLARLGPETPQPARVWLLRHLERIGGEESVPRLTELLDDEDAHIRELARRALQNNRAPSAAEPLRAALDEADDPAWRVAMINALAARGDQDSVPRFAELAQAEDADIAASAIAALGDLGGHAGSETLYLVWRGEDDVRCELAAAALLRVADRLLEHGERLRAGRLFRDMYDSSSPPALRIAALRGLVACEQLVELPTLLDIIRYDDDPRMRQMAARLLEEIPGEVVTLRIQRRLEMAPPAVQAVLIDVLATRGAKTAKSAIIETLGSDDKEVRVAALRALQDLGNASDVILLATAAATATGSELDAARTSLARLRGADVGVAILFAAQGDHDPAVRVELIRALAARHYKLGVVQLFEIARDPSDAVRAAVFETLRELAAESDLPQMIGLLVIDPSEEAREAAEDTVVAICLRDDDHERRAVPVLAVLDAAGSTGRAALIRVLGRLGGADALAAVRAALEEEDDIIVDAAVRTLSDWEDETILEDLWQIARQSPRENHRVLALRGCMRLLRLPNERSAGQTLELLKEAMSLAQRDEERRLVLGALSDVRTHDALEMVRPYLTEETLRDEAAVAMVAIARSLAGEHLAIAQSAIDEVLAAPISETALKQANEAVELIERFDGYVGTWLYAGPYSQEDMSYDDVFAEPFPPEAADAESVAWEHLAAAQPDNPWLFDLTKVVSCNDCCLYARIAIWSEAQQPARLEIGSDDGVKAWLGGDLVHENPVHRGLSPGRDKVDVTLEQGWNTLLLKIVQRRGGWGFACGVRAPDGQPLPGLKFKAE